MMKSDGVSVSVTASVATEAVSVGVLIVFFKMGFLLKQKGVLKDF